MTLKHNVSIENTKIKFTVTIGSLKTNKGMKEIKVDKKNGSENDRELLNGKYIDALKIFR